MENKIFSQGKNNKRKKSNLAFGFNLDRAGRCHIKPICSKEEDKCPLTQLTCNLKTKKELDSEILSAEMTIDTVQGVRGILR